MSAGLVEDDTAEAVFDDDGHLSGRAGLRVQHGQSGTAGLFRKRFDIQAFDEFISGVCARRYVAGLVFASGGGDRRDAQTAAGARIGDIQPFGIGDEHMLHLVSDPGGNLRDFTGERANGAVCKMQHVRLALPLYITGKAVDAVNIERTGVV